MKPTADIAVQRKKDYTSTSDQFAYNAHGKDIHLLVPKILEDSQKNRSAHYYEDFVVKEIDDSLIASFDLETFNHIKFTAWKKIKLFFEHTFPYVTQSFFNPFFRVLYGTFFDLQIKGQSNLKDLKGPILFISNHIGFYDSFIFDLFVTPFSHILPFRFMGSRKFTVPALTVLKRFGIIDLVYFLFGVFRITPGEGAERSLKKAYEIIRSKGTVVMYPEGKIWKPTHVHPEPIGPFKWGAAILAKNTGVKVVPVSFRQVKSGIFRPQLRVSIGAPYFVDRNLSNEEISLYMHESVKKLFLSQ